MEVQQERRQLATELAEQGVTLMILGHQKDRSGDLCEFVRIIRLLNRQLTMSLLLTEHRRHKKEGTCLTGRQPDCSLRNDRPRAFSSCRFVAAVVRLLEGCSDGREQYPGNTAGAPPLLAIPSFHLSLIINPRHNVSRHSSSRRTY